MYQAFDGRLIGVTTMGELSLGLSEGAICRFQVAAQNLEKELNVLNGLQIQSRGPKTEH